MSGVPAEIPGQRRCRVLPLRSRRRSCRSAAPRCRGRRPGRGRSEPALGLRRAQAGGGESRPGCPPPCLAPRSRARPSRRSSRTRTVPPAGVNLIAFESRLSSAWRRRCGSAHRKSRERSMSASRRSCFSSTAGSAARSTVSRISGRSVFCFSILSRPVTMRETSTIWFKTAVRAPRLRSIIETARLPAEPSASERSSASQI